MFKQECVLERWNIAKRFQLCYRCLAEGHHGKSCQRTRQCGKTGCLKLHHRLLHLHQDTSRSAVFEAKTNIRPCSTDLQHEHQISKAPSSAHVIFGTERKRHTEQRMNSNFMATYFNSGKMKVENTNTRLNLRELRADIDVSPGNKKLFDTNDGQTLLPKVEEPISCEARNPYGTGLSRKSTFLRRGTCHTIPPRRNQHVKFQNMAQILEHLLS